MTSPFLASFGIMTNVTKCCASDVMEDCCVWAAVSSRPRTAADVFVQRCFYVHAAAITRNCTWTRWRGYFFVVISGMSAVYAQTSTHGGSKRRP